MADADVIIVGFRCAGAPLAKALQAAGVRVVAIDKSPLFSDQPISTHAIQPYGMKMFDRLGLGDTVRALAPPNKAFRFQVEDSHLQITLNGTTMDSRSPRRCKLDPALQQAAIDAGVEVSDETRVIALLRDGDRVCGVRVSRSGVESEIRAPLVVGADGRNSTIAKLVDAPTYLESSSVNGVYWSYFEKTPVFDQDPRYDWGACIHIEGDVARAVFLTDSNLLLMAGGAHRDQLQGWKRDPTEGLLSHLKNGSLTAPLLEGSQMVAKPVGLVSPKFFMKQAIGPGWALVGDSGLHIDPTPGLGISDAVRDAADLSDAIIDGSEKAMRLYWRRRDAESIGLYHFAGEMGSPEYNNPFTRIAFKHAQKSPAMQQRMDWMMTREIRPQDMMPPSRVLAWLAAESLHGNFAPWTAMPRAARLRSVIDRQQKVLDRALTRAETGDLDMAVPNLAN